MIYLLAVFAYLMAVDTVAVFGSGRRIGYGMAFLASLLLTPALGYLISRSFAVAESTDAEKQETGKYSLGLTRVAGLLICANLIMFGLELVADAHGMTGEIEANSLRLQGFSPGQLITHMFLHNSVAHIYGNLCYLFLCAAVAEGVLGPLRFLSLYLVGGLSGALLQLISAPPNEAMLGSSACVFAVMTFFFLADSSYILDRPWLKAGYLMLPNLIYAPVALFLGHGGGVSHAAHVGGMAIGLLFYIFWYAKKSD